MLGLDLIYVLNKLHSPVVLKQDQLAGLIAMIYFFVTKRTLLHSTFPPTALSEMLVSLLYIYHVVWMSLMEIHLLRSVIALQHVSHMV